MRSRVTSRSPTRTTEASREAQQRGLHPSRCDSRDMLQHPWPACNLACRPCTAPVCSRPTTLHDFIREATITQARKDTSATSQIGWRLVSAGRWAPLIQARPSAARENCHALAPGTTLAGGHCCTASLDARQTSN